MAHFCARICHASPNLTLVPTSKEVPTAGIGKSNERHSRSSLTTCTELHDDMYEAEGRHVRHYMTTCTKLTDNTHESDAQTDNIFYTHNIIITKKWEKTNK
ncbi:hypothetical protein [Prevotella bivia]|uniref:hypothetical protein n=1 Tax=Prevotella bivia TaxID=28125 RepID=UPI00288A5FEC|nr:hypothetical protein [Prevotella bivia]